VTAAAVAATMPIGTTVLSSSIPPVVTALASGDGCGVESGEDVDGGAATGWIDGSPSLRSTVGSNWRP